MARRTAPLQPGQRMVCEDCVFDGGSLAQCSQCLYRIGTPAPGQRKGVLSTLALVWRGSAPAGGDDDPTRARRSAASATSG